MKIRTNSLCLTMCLTFLSAVVVAAFTGCVAGDRYNRSTGEYIDDRAVDSRVKDALDDNPEYKFEDVNVASFKGTVQLSGFVDTDAQKYSAGSIARQIQGVKDVENDITVKDQNERSTGEYVDDKSLTSRVKDALHDNPEYKFDEVHVSAYKGTLQLSGFVNTSDQKTKAEGIAKQVQGVQEVVNNITVKDKL